MTIGLQASGSFPAESLAEQMNQLRENGCIITNVEVCADKGTMYALVDYINEAEVMSEGV